MCSSWALTWYRNTIFLKYSMQTHTHTMQWIQTRMTLISVCACMHTMTVAETGNWCWLDWKYCFHCGYKITQSSSGYDLVGVDSKCGVQSMRKCESHVSCICIVGFLACRRAHVWDALRYQGNIFTHSSVCEREERVCVCVSARESVWESEKVSPCVRVRVGESGGKFVYTQ